MGFKASVIVWDFEAAIKNLPSRRLTLDLHKVLIQDINFSPDGKYLATLGGRDDQNLVIWDLANGTAVCGSPASTDSTLCVRWLHNSPMLVTGGYYNLRIWSFDAAARKIRPNDCVLGPIRRVITTICVDEEDEFVFCGTQTGDLIKVSVANGRLVSSSAYRYSLGVRCSTTFREISATGDVSHVVIIGNGDGTVVRLVSEGKKVIQQVSINKVLGAATSISLDYKGKCAYVGTDKGNTYLLNTKDLEYELKGTCHFESINDICFPRDCSVIFITCSMSDIRVWNSDTRQELLRIQVPNLKCNCIAITPNGKSIISGWDDGKIRAFFPESGRLQYVITDAHESVTSIASTNDSRKIISGGSEGMVRVWRVTAEKQTMEASLKEHKAAITCLKLRNDDSEAVSSSADGSCIAWDLHRYVRLNAFFASTMFNSILYHPDESQLLTCGSDRKITYWDASDGNAIRVIIPKGCEAELTALDIESTGKYFVCGGEDRLVKLWKYDEGYVTAVGLGHSGGIRKLKISPDASKIVSVGSEGAIFVWEVPAGGEQ